MTSHGTDGVHKNGRTVIGVVLFVVADKVAFAEKRMHWMHPGKVQLEQMLQDCGVRCYGCPVSRCRVHTRHFVVWRLECRALRCSGRRRHIMFHRRATQPFHDALIRLAPLEAVEDLWDLFMGGKGQEDLFCEVVPGSELLDVPDQLFLRLLEVHLVGAISDLCARSTSLAWLVTITLTKRVST